MSTRNLDLAQHYLLDTGATMIGPFNLQGSPSQDLMGATKAYVDTKVAQGGGGGGLGFPEAPTDGQWYARRGSTSQWLPTAPLNLATGKIDPAYLPGAFGTLNYRGGWNSQTNVPVLANGARLSGAVSPKGDYVAVLVGGTVSPTIDGISTVTAGDWIISNGTVWERQQNSAGAYLPIAGGTLTGPLTIQTGGTLSGVNEVRNTVNPAKVWADAAGNWGAWINQDGSWRLPTVTMLGLTATSLSVPTATIPTLNATTATIGTANVTALNVSGGNPTFDTLTLRNAGLLGNDPRNVALALAWTDPTGAVAGGIDTAGVFRFQTAVVGSLTTTNLVAVNYAPVSLTFGGAVTASADRRNRYAYAYTDGTDMGAWMLTSTGALAFNPASGVLNKHLQTRIERSHVLTQGPPSHSDSAATAGVSGTTYHLTCTLDTVGFEAIRLVLPAIMTGGGGTLTACVAVSASSADPINPKDGTGAATVWKPVSFASAGAAVDWEDQPYGSIQLTTTAVFTPQGTSVLTLTTNPVTAGVTVGMVCYIPAYSTGAAGIPLSDHWARVTAVTATTVTLSKPIQKMYNSGGAGNNGVPASWPVYFSPHTLTAAGYPGTAYGPSAILQVSDWIPISSLARSDGGRWPILMVRIYGTGGAFTTLVTDLSQTGWGGFIKDRIWSCFTQAGEFVSEANQAGFTSTTDNGTMALGWVQYYSRTRGATMMFSGDSITQGINTGSMQGWGACQLVATQLSTPSVPFTAVGMVNGWNGSGIGECIYVSALAHMDVFKPQVLALCSWTRNGEFNVPPAGQPGYSQESADWYFQQCLRIAQKAMRRYRTQTLYFPMGPSDAAEMTAATEIVRMTGTVRARQANQSGEMYLDQDALLGTGSTPVNDTWYPGLHPPAPGQMILSLDLARQIKSGLGIA